jgi:hypothetical protein
MDQAGAIAMAQEMAKEMDQEMGKALVGAGLREKNDEHVNIMNEQITLEVKESVKEYFTWRSKFKFHEYIGKDSYVGTLVVTKNPGTHEIIIKNKDDRDEDYLLFKSPSHYYKFLNKHIHIDINQTVLNIFNAMREDE